MPHRLKKRAAGTDAGAMSETALTPPNDTTPATPPEPMIPDGDAPRLGSAPITPPSPMGGTGTSVFNDTPAAPTLPVVSPVLSDAGAPMQTGADLPTLSAAPPPAAPAPAPAAPVAPTAETAPSIPAPSLPSLPTAAPAAPAAPASVTETTDDETVAAPTPGDAEHPMAHLMGGKSAPSEASQRAAQMRAAKKAKAKKVKIYTAIGTLVVSALVGPPLWSWFTNALAEAGGTTTEQPAD